MSASVLRQSPSRAQAAGTSQAHTPDDVRAAIERARQAQPDWAAIPARQRAALLGPLRTLIVDQADELAETIARETGKTRIDALSTEVLPAASAVAYYVRHAPRFLRDEPLRPSHFLTGNKRAVIHRVPYGVIGIISPWNYPLAIPFSEVIMGLLAGNAVVLKAASRTQATGRALERLIRAVVPDGVFQYVNLPGQLAGEAFLKGGVDKLLFTGSVAAGRQLMARAAETLTPVVLELGGNDPMLVCPDAHLERAAAGAVWAGLQNAGQSCGGVERIYVHQSVYEPFLNLLCAKVAALRVGPDDGTHQVDIGTMTTLEQAGKVRRQVEEAVQRGAEIRAEAMPPADAPETCLPAVVLTNVNHTMTVMREETFGPVLCVMPVRSMDEAVDLANDCELGLTASVWSRDTRSAQQLAQRIQAGVVMINDHLMSHGLPETPWGGFKQSGIGRTHGRLGFDEMTQPQCIIRDIFGFLNRNLWWHPYDARLYEGMRGLLEMMHAPRLSRRLHGLRKVAGILTRCFRK